MRKNSSKAQLFTIGIECSGSDAKCVEDCAKEGKGKPYIIKTQTDIKTKIIQALSDASEMSLINCKLDLKGPKTLVRTSKDSNIGNL